MTLREMFEAAEDEYLKFDRIPEADRRHQRPDLCAFLYLHDKLGAKRNRTGNVGDMIVGAEHDEIYLDYMADDCAALTPEDVVYLHRCGVRLGDDGLVMFA